jgi:hypothetical protein
MAQNKTFQVWSGLPTWAKGIIAVGGLAIVYFTGRAIIKKLGAIKEGKDSREAVRDAEQDKRKLINQGIKPSYTKTQYQTWANQIEQAFEGCDPFGNISWGSDSPLGTISYWSKSGYKVAMIFNQLKNNLDYLELSTAWGIRTYDACGWGTGDVKDVDLSKAIIDELNDGEVRDLNIILSKKGITYKV